MRQSGGVLALGLLSTFCLVYAQDEPDSDEPDLDQPCNHLAKWQVCNQEDAEEVNDRLQCATITVSRNYKTQEDGEEINLRLVRYAVVDDIDTANTFQSIITNPGGPGGSGIQDLLSDFATYNRLSGGQFNIISFDPRGVGQTMAYMCTDTDEDDPGNNYLADDFYADASTFYEGQAATCLAQVGDFQNLVGTIQTAKDVFAISKATAATGGDALIRFWGFSYGTLLGNTIARLFPERIGGMILDGNINPNDYYFGSSLPSSTDLDSAYQKFFRLCGAAPEESCPFSVYEGDERNYDNLMKKFNAWVGIEPFEENRGRTDTASVLTVDQNYKVRDTIFNALYRPDKFKETAQTLESWYNDPSQIPEDGGDDEDENESSAAAVKRQEEEGDDEDTVDPNFDPSEEFPEQRALFGIRCLDSEYRPPTDANFYSRLYRDYLGVSIYGGDAALVNEANCAAWEIDPPETFENIPWAPNQFRTNREILFVQTYFDPVTPLISAQTAKTFYQDARIVYTNGVGHLSTVHVSTDLQAVIQQYWTDDDFLPVDETEYAVVNPNPFTADPMAGQATVSTDAETQQSAESRTVARRDLSYLFKGLALPKRSNMVRKRSPSIHKRQMDGGVITDVEYIVCGPEDANNITTTTRATFTQSTRTTSLTTTTTTPLAMSTMTSAPIWPPYANQPDCAPVTKVICNPKGCRTSVYAIPTQTTYVDYVHDLCDTGLCRNPVTVTATCDQGCEAKPTGVPQGYHATEVFCSKCAHPSSVTVTVKNGEGWVDAAAPTDASTKGEGKGKPPGWSDSDAAEKGDGKGWVDADGKGAAPAPAHGGQWADDDDAAPAAGGNGKLDGWSDANNVAAAGGSGGAHTGGKPTPAAASGAAGWSDAKGGAAPVAGAAGSGAADGWSDNKVSTSGAGGGDGQWADATGAGKGPAAAAASGGAEWADAQGEVGEYTGGGSVNVVGFGGVVVAVLVGLWVL